jgi:hypothetical protein
MVEQKTGKWEYIFASFNVGTRIQCLGLCKNFALSYKLFFEMFKRNLERNFENSHLNIIHGEKVHLFRICGIVSKYTEANNKEAKPSSLLVFLHSCDL